MIRVGFTKVGGRGWQGGHNYLVNLLRFLVDYQSDILTPVLFVDPLADEQEMSDYHSIEGLIIVHSEAFSDKRKLPSLLKSLLFGRDSAIAAEFQMNAIDVVFEVAQYFGWRLGIPAVAWMPDFQHRDLPEYFGRLAWWKRDIGFRIQIASSRKVMLSSFDAKSACEKYYKVKAGQTEVVSFAVPGVEVDRSLARREVERKYGLTSPFFFMPNHFWIHKNHRLVVEALAILKAKGIDNVVVVATGNTVDPRNPDNFRLLEEEVKLAGLTSNFRMLGLVPYSDVQMLMAASRGLLNPSLYEGWSTTVEEAKSIGAPLLLSDLAVHKEQSTENVAFFERHSASSLAEALAVFSIPWAESKGFSEEFSSLSVRQFAEAFASLVLCINSQRNLS